MFSEIRKYEAVMVSNRQLVCDGECVKNWVHTIRHIREEEIFLK